MLLVLVASILHIACAFSHGATIQRISTHPSHQADVRAHFELEKSRAQPTAVFLETRTEKLEKKLRRTWMKLFEEDAPNNITEFWRSALEVAPENVTSRHYWVITHTRRHQHQVGIYRRTVKEFLQTAGVLEVCFVLSSLGTFLWMYTRFLDWPNPKTRHWAALLGWIVWAAMCLGAVFVVRGPAASAGWMTGYLLELIFSIENVFVFHVICQAFRAPAALTQKALYLVILGQVAFQAIFFMGLAHWLHSSLVLPYILGSWLIYVGLQATRDHNEEKFDVRDSGGFRFFQMIMGRRLSPEFPEDGHLFFRLPDGRTACTMLAPLTLCLFVVDVLFEVDVTLTKIETLNKDFMCFSSSVVAACAVPELYFAARNIFEKYSLLRYGISFVLVFYGAQLLLHNYFELPALTGVFFVMAVMGLCMSCSNSKPQSNDKGTEEKGIWDHDLRVQNLYT